MLSVTAVNDVEVAIRCITPLAFVAAWCWFMSHASLTYFDLLYNLEYLCILLTSMFALGVGTANPEWVVRVLRWS